MLRLQCVCMYVCARVHTHSAVVLSLCFPGNNFLGIYGWRSPFLLSNEEFSFHSYNENEWITSWKVMIYQISIKVIHGNLWRHTLCCFSTSTFDHAESNQGGCGDTSWLQPTCNKHLSLLKQVLLVLFVPSNICHVLLFRLVCFQLFWSHADRCNGINA